MIDQTVLDRFRELTRRFHELNGSVANAERRRNGAIGARSALQQERARLASVRYATNDRHAEHLDQLADLDQQISRIEAEVAALTDELEQLETRRNDANSNASRARDFLVERYGLARSALEY